MARCPDCNKFVSYDTDQDPEVEGEDASGTTFTATVRRVLPCGDCGTELKEYTFDVDHDFADALDEAHEKCSRADEEYEWEVTGCIASTADGVRDTDRKGRKIRSARYMTTLYGFELEVDLKCQRCQHEIAFPVKDEIEASCFEGV